MFDKDLIRFHGKVLSVAEKEFRASCSGKETEPFVEHLFKRYKAEGASESVEPWLSRTLAEYYLCVDKRPAWVESEPAWPFHDGRPMVFVTQYTLPKNQVTEEHATWGTVLYLFAIREKCADGYTMIYKVIEQTNGLAGEGEV